VNWCPIQTIPCCNDLLKVRYRNGEEYMTLVDHDSDPTWWVAQGATHWRAVTERELDDYYSQGWK
jgi:hypothetical protein